MTRVHICDYGIGNIHNVARAIRHVGAETINCTSPDQLTNVERLVIPGVGAFASCMTAFTKSGFTEPVLGVIQKGIPVLAICVGMQMLADVSDEFGTHEGLGIIKGRIKRLPDTAVDGSSLAVPHISWSKLYETPTTWRETPLQHMRPEAYAYFIHSYFFDCVHEENQLATFAYGGRRFTAAVRRDNVVGTQFPPEKSADAGLKLLTHFVQHNPS